MAKLKAHASAVSDRVNGLSAEQADRCIRVDCDLFLALLDAVERMREALRKIRGKCFHGNLASAIDIDKLAEDALTSPDAEAI